MANQAELNCLIVKMYCERTHPNCFKKTREKVRA